MSLHSGVPLEVTRSIAIRRSPHDVFAYLCDWSRAREWRTEVVESTAVPTGPLRVGTQLHEVSLLAGDRIVTVSVVEAYEPPLRVSFGHVSGPIPASGEFVVHGVHGGARLTYTLRVQLLSWWALAAPVFSRADHGTIDRSLAALAANLHAGRDVADREAAA